MQLMNSIYEVTDSLTSVKYFLRLDKRNERDRIGLIDSVRRGHATPKYHNATFKVFTKASCVASLAFLCYEHITSILQRDPKRFP